MRVPLVCGAVLFDLVVGRADVRPDAAAGEAACERRLARRRWSRARSAPAPAPRSARCSGFERVTKTGLGSASLRLAGGVTVGRARGRQRLRRRGRPGERPGARRAACARRAGSRAPASGCASTRRGLRIGGSTTLAVVATDAGAHQAEAAKVARMAHDGLARTIDPVHTMLDGDTVFALATGPAGVAGDVTTVGRRGRDRAGPGRAGGRADGHRPRRDPPCRTCGRSRERPAVTPSGGGGRGAPLPQPRRPRVARRRRRPRSSTPSTAPAAPRARGAPSCRPSSRSTARAAPSRRSWRASLPGEGALGAKWVTLFPGNRALGLPVTNGLVVLSDPRTGLPEAVMDAGHDHGLADGRERRRRRALPRAARRRPHRRARLRRAGARRRAGAGGGAARPALRGLPRRRGGGGGGVRHATWRPSFPHVRFDVLRSARADVAAAPAWWSRPSP